MRDMFIGLGFTAKSLPIHSLRIPLIAKAPSCGGSFAKSAGLACEGEALALRLDKLRSALARLEKFSRDDSLGKRSLRVKRRYREMKEEFVQKTLEELQMESEKRLEELEELRMKKGNVARLTCRGCGREADFDLSSIIYLSRMFGVNPDAFLLCPACRSQKGVKRRLKREIRRSGSFGVM